MKGLNRIFCWLFGHEWTWTYTRNVGDEFDTRHGMCEMCGKRYQAVKSTKTNGLAE